MTAYRNCSGDPLPSHSDNRSHSCTYPLTCTRVYTVSWETGSKTSSLELALVGYLTLSLGISASPPLSPTTRALPGGGGARLEPARPPLPKPLLRHFTPETGVTRHLEHLVTQSTRWGRTALVRQARK